MALCAVRLVSSARSCSSHASGKPVRVWCGPLTGDEMVVPLCPACRKVFAGSVLTGNGAG
jgi:hypothetical protein